MDALRGTHAEVPLWLCLKWLESAPGRGLLGLRVGETERWFWVLDGHVTFAWSTAPSEHLLDRWRSAGFIATQAALGVHPVTPEGLLSALPPDVAEMPAWEAFWTDYYVELLRRVLEGLPDVRYLWLPWAWTSHSRMVALAVGPWVEQAVERMSRAGVLREELERLGASVSVSVEALPPPESLRPSQQRVLDVLRGPTPLADVLRSPPFRDDDVVLAFWTLLYRGVLRLQPSTRPAPTLRDLLDFYSTAFSVVGRYLEREIEGLAPLVLQKNVTRMEAQYPDVFEGLTLDADYRIDHWEPQVRSLLRQRLITLEDFRHFLEETLMLHLLSVQNILGPAHYTTVVEILQTLTAAPTR